MQELVVESLVVSLTMVMLDVLVDDEAYMPLAERDDGLEVTCLAIFGPADAWEPGAGGTMKKTRFSLVAWRAWGVPVRCGAGMVALQTLLALYRFGDTTALLQLVNPLMWLGLGLFFVTGWVIGWVVERLLRGTTGRFRTLLLGATILATPVAVAGSLVGGLFGPPGVLLYGLIPYLLLVGIPRLIGKGWAVWTRHGV